MPHTKSTQRVSIDVRRKENEAKICKFLQDRAGPPPTDSLCSKHKIERKQMCTGQTDPSLYNAGRWFSYCRPCNYVYFAGRTIDIYGLAESNDEFRALIEERRSLAPKSRPHSSTAASVSKDNRPTKKVFIFWAKSGHSPTSIPFVYNRRKPLRLLDYQLLLAKKGVQYQEVDVFDTEAKAWKPLRWSEEYSCGERKNILLKHTGLHITNFGKFCV